MNKEKLTSYIKKYKSFDYSFVEVPEEKFQVFSHKDPLLKNNVSNG